MILTIGQNQRGRTIDRFERTQGLAPREPVVTISQNLRIRLLTEHVDVRERATPETNHIAPSVVKFHREFMRAAQPLKTQRRQSTQRGSRQLLNIAHSARSAGVLLAAPIGSSERVHSSLATR